MNLKYKNISILGSTGSIGTQSLEVLDEISNDYQINYLTTNSNIELLSEQIKKYKPKGVVICNKDAYHTFKNQSDYIGEVLFGKEGLNTAAADNSNDIVISALVGFSGVEPAYHCIKNGINIALANKESLVSAGTVLTELAKETGAEIIAVDSEHSAIFQCLSGEKDNDIEKLILTASGGPFLNHDVADLENISVEQALAHPNWSMGSKITIDSATMMNKGFEVIEAYWLFGVPLEKIEVVIHPQSIIHSMVQFMDGSVKAQLGLPDMKIPIAYALTYPYRFKLSIPRMNFFDIANLTFIKPDLEKFRCLKLAYNCLEVGGSSCTILNAANEIAVYKFLAGKLAFSDIPKLIEKTLEKTEIKSKPSFMDIIETDNEARVLAESFIK